MNKVKLRLILEQFFLEDIGDRDVTSDSLFPIEAEGEFTFIAKEAGIFCGTDVIDIGFRLLHDGISIEKYKKDGDEVQIGDTIAIITGPVRELLKGERVVLNLIQRMSGIATNTKKAIETLNSDVTRVCDTRKTTPGLRMLEKYAVRCGGGANHRYGLYDAVMIKDNHISFAGSITKAVQTVRKETGHMVKVEVETETKDQVIEAIEAGADVIMFDNRTPDEISEWISLVPYHITTEASGGITLDNIATYQNTGVNYISLGSLTHSVKALDISAKVIVKQGGLQ